MTRGDTRAESHVMRTFWIVDLTANGEARLKQEYEYELLADIPGAIDLITLFSTHLWRDPEQFIAVLPGERLSLRWRACSQTTGIATLWYRQDLASLSVLLCGTEPDHGADTLQPVQTHLLRELHDTGIEPAFDLMHIPHRPLPATLNLRAPAEREDQLLFALADRCLAASYFRKMGLA
jgi:hypothetical protein